MHLRSALGLALLILAASAPAPGAGEDEVPTKEVAPVTITVLYDNRGGSEGLTSAWGFSCLIEGLPETILFDTGGDSPTLLGNMATLGVAPDRIDVVVLSHEHRDHTGGLAGFLDVRGAVPVYLLPSFPAGIAEAARERGAEVIEVGEPMAICAGATVSGDVSEPDEINEQYLFLSGDAGGVVVTGCAHPGVVDMVEHARERFGRDVLAVIGGFHLLRHSDAAVDEITRRLKALGVERAVPCHCTGDGAIERFAVSYGDSFSRCSVGTVVDLGALLTTARE